jgi:hypothetical protein
MYITSLNNILSKLMGTYRLQDALVKINKNRLLKQETIHTQAELELPLTLVL